MLTQEYWLFKTNSVKISDDGGDLKLLLIAKSISGCLMQVSSNFQPNFRSGPMYFVSVNYVWIWS